MLNDCSIIVPTYHPGEIINNLLNSLPEVKEIIILDNSDDVTLNANLGVGITPNANYSDTSWNAIDVSTKGGLVAYDGNSGTTGETLISTNAYHNGTNWKAKTNGESSGYSAKQDGTHTFYGTRGTSVVADADVTFNELFKINLRKK